MIQYYNSLYNSIHSNIRQIYKSLSKWKAGNEAWPSGQASISKGGRKQISPWAARNVMERIPTCACWNRTTGRSAGSASGHSQCLNGRATKAYIKGRACVRAVANRRTYARFVHWIWSSAYPWRSGIGDAAKMGSICWTKILLMLTVSNLSRLLLLDHLQWEVLALINSWFTFRKRIVMKSNKLKNKLLRAKNSSKSNSKA